MQDLIEGLQILQKYNCDVFAEHDEIGVVCGDDLCFADIFQLEKLGWSYVKEYEAWCKYV